MSSFETVPAAEAPSRARGNLMILVLALSCFVFGCAYQYILGVPDQVAQIAGIDLSQVSLMMGVYGVCNAIGTPLLVMALTSRGPKTLLLVSLALMAAGMAICAATPIYLVILTGRAVMGVGNGTFAATAYIAASRIAGPSRAASAMSNVALGFSASFVFALPAARMLRNVITWQLRPCESSSCKARVRAAENMEREPSANSRAISTTRTAGIGRPLARSGKRTCVQRGCFAHR